MQNTNYKHLIYLGIFIVLITAISTLWKAGWFDQKTHDITQSDYLLNDTILDFSILLPTEPTKTAEVLEESGFVFKITHYKSITPAKNQIIMNILSVECDTCSLETKNELVMKVLIYLLKSKDISISSGQDYKMGEYDAFKFEKDIEGVPTEYVTCTINDKGYIYSETFANVTKGVSAKYFSSLQIK